MSIDYKDRNRWLFYREGDSYGDWRWRLKDVNGQVIGASTEGYKNKADCESNAGRLGWDNSQPTSWSEDAESERE